MIDIIEEVADAIRFNSNVVSISDNLNNSYTLSFVKKENILRIGQTIDILGSDNFDGSYTAKVVTDTTITINKQSGIATTGNLGKIKQKAPFTDFATWVSYSNFLDGEINFKNEIEQNTFPAIKLARFKTTVYKGVYTIDNIEVYLIDFTKSNLLDKDRITQMEYIYKLKNLFISELVKHKKIINFAYGQEEYRNSNLTTSNFTNVLKLDLTNIKFLNCN